MRYVLVTNQHDYILDNGKKVKNIERTSSEFIEFFSGRLKALRKTVIIYPDKEMFRDNIQKHLDDYVINFDFGYKSRTRNMSVPALCELYEIKYYNPDPYVQILCQDKYLTKKYVESFGIKTAASFLITSEDGLDIIDSLNCPLIVKPNYESESIGITQDSIVDSIDKAKEIVIEKLNEFKSPIIVEEYVDGKEIAMTLLRTDDSIDIFYEIEIQIIGLQEGQHSAFTYEIKKKIMEGVHTERVKSNFVGKEDREKIERLVKSLKSGRLIRIDGRISDGQLYILEINANPGMREDSVVPDTFKAYGHSYDDMMKMIFD